MAPELSNAILDVATQALMATGVRVFQGARLADTEAGHVSELLRLMAPSQGAVIADVGCGIGEVARLMRRERPDLFFALVNKNRLQLSLGPLKSRGFWPVLCDMHDIPLFDARVNGCMFLYSLCHADFPVALAEAARITKPGGFLFVYDYERTHGDNDLFEAKLSARAISRDAMEFHAREAGWMPDCWWYLNADDAPFREAYGDDAEYDRIFNDLRVCAWKMRRA
jgi:SAM-dependent methyltransferase